ncbi:transglutaminase-like domain-containing protein [Streptomyces sp. NPDC048275]|uniref:transglutaminase-like domain-containing protein n=1 Tax=Streptomyces sp. NPDC048275 TaxID=3155629 RepID=UPI0033FAF001
MDFYLTQSAYSEPGDLDVSGLPRDPGQLAGAVRDVIIHRGEGERFGYVIPRERLHEDAESRYVGVLLRILRERKDAPLTERRPPAERFVGTCRDFALLHCSLLRATGTPARIRCGFATYFIDGFHEDHWVTEYRLPDGSWRLVDAQIAYGPYDVNFDPLDVPRDQFVVAGQAWRECRAGRADPAAFGVSWLEGFKGLWYIRGNIVHDLAALNGVEVLPWDGWGPEILDDTGLTEDELALIDAVAAADSEDELRRLYHRDPRLTVPDEIRSYTTYTGLRQVTLRRSGTASPGGSTAATPAR